jgi:pyruvate carboxylase
MRKETFPFLIKENEEGIGICVNILELTLMLQKLYNPADRDAEKAFQRLPFYVEDGNPQHIAKVIFSKKAGYP